PAPSTHFSRKALDRIVSRSGDQSLKVWDAEADCSRVHDHVPLGFMNDTGRQPAGFSRFPAIRDCREGSVTCSGLMRLRAQGEATSARKSNTPTYRTRNAIRLM